MTTDNDPLAATKAELPELERELTQRLGEMDRSDSRPKMDGAVGRLTFMDEYQQHQMAEHGRRNVESCIHLRSGDDIWETWVRRQSKKVGRTKPSMMLIPNQNDCEVLA